MHILSTFKQPIFCHLKGRDCYNKVSNSPNFNDHKTKRLIIYGLRKRHNWSSQFEMSILKAKTNTQANLKTFLVKSIFSVEAYVTCVCLLVCSHFHIGFNSSKDHTLQALLINFVKEFYLISSSWNQIFFTWNKNSCTFSKFDLAYFPLATQN